MERLIQLKTIETKLSAVLTSYKYSKMMTRKHNTILSMLVCTTLGRVKLLNLFQLISNCPYNLCIVVEQWLRTIVLSLLFFYFYNCAVFAHLYLPHNCTVISRCDYICSHYCMFAPAVFT